MKPSDIRYKKWVKKSKALQKEVNKHGSKIEVVNKYLKSLYKMKYNTYIEQTVTIANNYSHKIKILKNGTFCARVCNRIYKTQQTCFLSREKEEQVN